MVLVVPSPDPVVGAAIISQTAATNAQQQGGKIQSMIQKVKEWIAHKQEWLQNKIDEHRWRIQKVIHWGFMFANFMRMMFQFFSLIVLARMIIGFFSKPLEFIMLGISCIFLSVTFVIYYILSIPPFIYIPFLIWFIIFDLVPLVVYTTVMLALFIVITIFCLILGILNWATKGSLKNLVLCQNHVAGWYKTPNFHLTNKYERGFFCNRQCYTGYYPDTTGMFCVRVPKGAPSYCPQAEVMRLYTGNRNDSRYYFRDYQTMGNMKYLTGSPESREQMLKEHYLRKRDFLEKCDKAMKDYNYMPLSLCSNIDIMDKNNFDANDMNRMKMVCSQAFCNSRTNYPFCSLMAGSGEEDDSDFWKRVMQVLIKIITFMIVITFTISYMAGVTGK